MPCNISEPTSLMDYSAFSTTKDAVADLGLDDTGSNEVDSTLESELENDGTLIEFPNGTYKFGDMWATGVRNVGITNKPGHEPKIVTPSLGNVTENVCLLIEGDGVLLEGFEFDFTDRSDPGPYAQIKGEGGGNMYVNDLHFRGYVARRALTCSVTNSNGIGLVENLRCRDGHQDGEVGSGILVNQSDHVGEMGIRDCEIWHFASGGIYASESGDGTMGPLKIKDCYLKNNNTGGVRMGQDQGEVCGCLFVYNDDIKGETVTWSHQIPNHSNNFRVARAFRMRGAAAGDVVTADNNDFIHNAPTDIDDGQCVSLRGDFNGQFHLDNSRLHHDYPDGKVIDAQDGGDLISINNTELTGTGSDSGYVIEIAGRDDSEVVDSCINMSGSNQKGIFLQDLTGYLVDNTSITVPGDQIAEDNASGTQNNITSGSSCTAASRPNESFSTNFSEY